MGRLRHILYIIGGFISVCILYGCNASGCLENRSAIPLAGFYSSATDKNIAIDSLIITGIGKPGDEPMYDGTTSLSSVYLPMRSTKESTAWEFKCKASYTLSDGTIMYVTLADTIAFEYSASPYFASDECGVIYKYHINHMDYTTNLIDYVVITDSLITNVDTERIKIYFRTHQPEIE